MLYLLDTSEFSALMRNDPGSAAGMAKLSETDQVSISVIVRGEILHGIMRLPSSKRRAELQTRANLHFDDLECLPIDERIADVYARMRSDCERIGLSLDNNDLWIAATALAKRATLVSRDADFARIDGLLVVDWSA